VIQDAENAARRTMFGQASSAVVARPATGVDFTYDAPTTERSAFGNADEFVPEDAAKSHITADELQVGLADPGTQHAHGNLPRRRHGSRMVGPESDAVSTQYDRSHFDFL
jgi:hypothetical protein